MAEVTRVLQGGPGNNMAVNLLQDQASYSLFQYKFEPRYNEAKTEKIGGTYSTVILVYLRGGDDQYYFDHSKEVINYKY